MPAYLMVRHEISDAAQYQLYAKAAVPLLVKHGGKPIVRGGVIETLEGRVDDRQLAVFEFPTLAAIHAFWDSPEYIPMKKMREGAAVLDVWAIEGV
jgi:uncharacterized protein (DUF1330 family)